MAPALLEANNSVQNECFIDGGLHFTLSTSWTRAFEKSLNPLISPPQNTF